MHEHWKEIPGYEGIYWVSDLGRIKSKNGIGKLRLHKGRKYYTVGKDAKSLNVYQVSDYDKDGNVNFNAMWADMRKLLKRKTPTDKAGDYDRTFNNYSGSGYTEFCSNSPSILG